MAHLENHTDTCDKEHQSISGYIKDMHLFLRKSAAKLGAEKAWKEHCNNKEGLKKYAQFMEKLATTHWANNESQSRITWAADFCLKYFIHKQYTLYNEKEKIIGDKLDLKLDFPNFSSKVKLLDVGSCYNPFDSYKTFLDVMPIDLCPANNSVLCCDILDVLVGPQTLVKDGKVQELQKESFDAVVFSFVLEYIPSSELRISACNKAYILLKPGGILIICTPDSKHVGANAKLMKTWRYTLALIGFTRIHYSKYKYIHCMSFRKSLHKQIPRRWTELNKEPYMNFAINIPQDFNKVCDQNILDAHNYNKQDPSSNEEIFQEMPFYDIEII